MRSPLTNRMNLTGMSMLFLPIAMVKVMSVSLGIGAPASVDASSSHPSTRNFSLLNREVLPASELEVAATAYEAKLRQLAFEKNPLLYGASSERENTSIGAPGLSNTLQMIMATSTGAVALINNKQYRVGDLLSDGLWEITAISNQDRQVRLRQVETGREAVLNVD